MKFDEWTMTVLGSAREARNWYWPGARVLSDVVATHGIRLLTQSGNPDAVDKI